MLLLIFHAGADRYAIDSRAVVEIVPFVQLSEVPHAPVYIAGLLNFRGRVVPVVDACQLLKRQSAKQVLSSRIIVAKVSIDGTDALVGLLAEHVTEAVKIDAKAKTESPVNVSNAPYLSEVVLIERNLLQCLDVSKLIPVELRRALEEQNPVEVGQ